MTEPVHEGTAVPHEAGHAKVFPPLDPSTFAPQIIWLAITFTALYVILSRFALPRVGEVIEVISFLSRPLSHSVRLFANMLAGHITLKVFGGFVVMLLGAAGAVKALAPLPLLMATALTALEFLVAFLQAYVFTMLTCMYLNDALHPGH